EDERRTLSRELHDDIGQSITAIKLAATSLTDESLGGDPEARREILDEVIAIADQTVHKLRDLSLLLRPPQLDSLGLEPALRGQIALLSRNSRVRIELDVAPGFPARPTGRGTGCATCRGGCARRSSIRWGWNPRCAARSPCSRATAGCASNWTWRRWTSGSRRRSSWPASASPRRR